MTEQKVVDHTSKSYLFVQSKLDQQKYNGAYYYSKEIVEYFIPNIKTDYNWVTVNTPYLAYDHSIVFIHNNREPEKLYDWLHKYEDLILVCSVPQTMERVAHLGTPIYLPLSVNVKEVEKYRVEEKTRDCAFAGRLTKSVGHKLPRNCDMLGGVKREDLLISMAEYKTIYAVGRTAIEAKILGCEVEAYDEYYPDPDFWQIYDSREAAKELQRKLKEEV